MATTAVRVLEYPVGPTKCQIWTVTIGGADTTATWDTGLDNVVHVSLTTTSDQAFGGTYLNYSDAGTTVAAGNIHIAGLANSSVCTVRVEGN